MPAVQRLHEPRAHDQNDPVIVAGRRTPIGRAYKGSLTTMRPDDLAAVAIEAALADVEGSLPDIRDEVEDLILGCAQPAGEAGFNMARVVASLVGLPRSGGVTVNRYCASSLQSLAMASHAIRAGDGEVFVAAGVETVSRYRDGGADSGPQNQLFTSAHEHTSAAVEAGFAWSPSPEHLPDVYVTMGTTAELVSATEGVSREDQDAFAARSHQCAAMARESGFFNAEITPVTLSDGTLVTQDDCIRPTTTPEVLAKLSPVFHPGGTVTAGNSCPLNDGASALVVMSRRRAGELGLTPLARVLGSAAAPVAPELMGLGPVAATERLLGRLGLAIADFDRYEINEAFAAQVIPSARLLGMDFERLNTRGGAIALGHPYGMSGARLVLTLINALRHDNMTLGLATMCIGGGQGMALAIEREE
jgi:acetyl-CoA C-acetyltransferase